MAEIKIKNINDVTVEQIDHVYSGKANTCCCGCAGQHTYSPMSKKRMLNKLRGIAAAGGTLDYEGDYIAFQNDSRINIIYLKK